MYLQGLYVDDTNKVLMCSHGKVGATTWKTILANNTVKNPIMKADIKIHATLGRYGIKKLSSGRYSEQDINDRLENYFKFMVVRHPFDR